MKLIVAISILNLIRAEDNQSAYIINGVQHNKEILFENLHRHFNYNRNNLAVDYKTNILYLDWYATAEVAVFNLNTKNHTLITGISKPQCITVDQVNHDIFIGTERGIYKYNVTTGDKEIVGARGEDVFRIYHYNGVLYYRKYGIRTEIRTLVDGYSVRYHDYDLNIRNFVIDSEENMLIVTYDGSLYRYKDATQDYFLYEESPVVKSLTTDRFGNVYFSADDGIYKVKGDDAERVLNISNPQDIAFDSDNNLIYYNNKQRKLYRLKPINIPNNGSDSHKSHIQEVEVTNNNDIKTELKVMNNKIDNLPQVINMLLTNLIEKQLAHSNSPRTIHLDSIVLKNITISIGLDEPGVAQISST